MLTAIFPALLLATSSFAATHYVSVGGTNPDGTPALVFSPNNFQADIGDEVVFTFHVKNHTVTQSSFNEPCAKMTDAWGNLNGFDSGFMPVSPNDTNLPTFTIKVYDTKPIWGYCRQLNPPSTHCRSGMVFGINTPSYGNTFYNFVQLAAQSTSQNSLLPPSSTSTSTTGSAWYTQGPQTHQIVVGGDPKTVGFTYNPPNISANVGDTVEFVFMQKNHTVTQASFGEPCRPLADTTYPSVKGFDSGFMFVSPNQTGNFPTFSIKINDTNPIWAYCRQQAANFSHCGVGMVAAINANPYSNKSFFDFQQLAVHQNGSGFVDPFGNLTSAPSSTAVLPGSGKSAEKDVAANLDAGDSDSTLSASQLKRIYDLAPVALGLIGLALILLTALLSISIVLLRRSGKSAPPTRSVNPEYQQVPLTMPSSKMTDAGSHDYETPRYSD
ncbi:hypothetical protein SCHPADRAFT_934419 [Schizopora paradoxa]|uniref:Cupredoxin n=1 Tax=Schizopora paradoxa TaxID=27342 RepID=A0A0H2SFJ5_9AGAM|nr:hypothetical protein SCHPADRAFT_934419 [Schizopora paradoxa]